LDFTLSEEQEIVRKTVREFAETVIGPRVRDMDEKQEFPRDIMRQLGEMGFLGVVIPPEYGGAGMRTLDYAVVIEELSRVDGAIGLSVAAHNSLCTGHIFHAGNETQKRKYIPDLAAGKTIGAWSLTEPTAGSDAGGTRTTAVRDGDSWVLNGSKTFTTHGSVGDVCVVFAVTNPEKKKKGISAFILERGMKGFRAGKKEDKLGCRASDTSEVIMEDCRVPASQLVGEEGHGFIDAMKILDGGRISIAALAVGMAQGAFEASLRYSRQREQFNQSISSFQSIQWYLADMATRIEAARLLTYRAAQMKDAGVPFTKEAAMAKLHAGETSVWVADRAVQIHGGYGFIKGYRAEKYYRDCKICTIGEGTSEIQRLVIARQLLKQH
jgi:alkylation response protein AidB-like acyl-CoA dehydrogenase